MTISHRFAKLFSYPEGKDVLNYLKQITQERVLSPQATNEELRFVEGQRAFVRMILSLIQHGQEKGEIK